MAAAAGMDGILGPTIGEESLSNHQPLPQPEQLNLESVKTRAFSLFKAISRIREDFDAIARSHAVPKCQHILGQFSMVNLELYNIVDDIKKVPYRQTLIAVRQPCYRLRKRHIWKGQQLLLVLQASGSFENTTSPLPYANSPRSGASMMNTPSPQQHLHQLQLQQRQKIMQLPQQQLIAAQQLRQSSLPVIGQVLILLLYVCKDLH